MTPGRGPVTALLFPAGLCAFGAGAFLKENEKSNKTKFIFSKGSCGALRGQRANMFFKGKRCFLAFKGSLPFWAPLLTGLKAPWCSEGGIWGKIGANGGSVSCSFFSPHSTPAGEHPFLRPALRRQLERRNPLNLELSRGCRCVPVQRAHARACGARAAEREPAAPHGN